MMLMHHYFSKPIKFLENTINVLVIENPIIFTKFIQQLIHQKDGYDGDFILSKNYTPIDINKNIELITDIFKLDFNNKKISNKLFSLLKNVSNLDMLKETQNLYKQIHTYLNQIIQFCDYPLTYQEDIDITYLFKSCNLSIDIFSDNMLENILNYILLYRNIFDIKLFVFVNIKCVLSKNEFLEFYKFINYEKIDILLIENTIKSKITPYEKIRIIDQDICEIY